MLKLVKMFKNEIKLAKEIILAQNETIMDFWMLSDSEKINEYFYAFRGERAKKFLRKNNLAVCLTTYLQLSEEVPVVFIDEYFELLSKETQQFILAHEEGHIEGNLLSTKRNIEFEYLADTYAMKKLNLSPKEVIQYLTEVKEVVNTFSCMRDVNKRINYFKKML